MRMDEVKFTAQQVELLADLISDAADKPALVRNLASLFAESAPKFKWGEFKLACGLPLDGSEPVYEEVEEDDEDDSTTDLLEWHDGIRFYLSRDWGEIVLRAIDPNDRYWAILRVGDRGIARFSGVGRILGLPLTRNYHKVAVMRGC